MNSEIQILWHEIRADFASPAVLWQMGVIVSAIVIALAINGALRAYVRRSMPESWVLAIDGINRLLFPISTLFMVWLGKLMLHGWHHTSMLQLAIKLFVAMASVRLFVYAVRYIFSPSGWLKALESGIAWVVWILLALHLSGYSTQMVEALESVQFNIGKNPVNLWILLQGLLTIVLTLFIALWLSRVIENKLMRASNVNVNMRVVLVKLIRILFTCLAVLFALSAVGLDITLLSVFGGALGVGLGFGLQKIASNYVSGFIILLDKSMQIGDIITVDKHHGVIQDMRSRYMVLGKMDGTNVIIPNEVLITTAVINHSLTEHKGKVQVSVNVSYGSALETAMQLMQDVAEKQDRVLQMPKPVVQIKGFGEHGVELVLTTWVNDPQNPTASLQSDLYMAIWRVFQAERIQLTKPEKQEF